MTTDFFFLSNALLCLHFLFQLLPQLLLAVQSLLSGWVNVIEPRSRNGNGNKVLATVTTSRQACVPALHVGLHLYLLVFSETLWNPCEVKIEFLVFLSLSLRLLLTSKAFFNSADDLSFKLLSPSLSKLASLSSSTMLSTLSFSSPLDDSLAWSWLWSRSTLDLGKNRRTMGGVWGGGEGRCVCVRGGGWVR